MVNKDIYLDHAATTYVDPEVLKAMIPYFTDIFANPQSLHTAGKTAQISIDNSRETIAKIRHCQSSEIVFTSGGTESNNLAILGLAKTFKAAHPSKKHHCITSKIEHSSVLETFNQLEKEGWKVTYLDVDSEGFIDINQLKSTVTEHTALVSIIYANNEIGTIQNIPEIAKICRAAKVPFHTDACQAAGALDLNVQNLHVDLMTINGSKIYGPKGAGALYVKQGISISPIMYGGHQENGMRPGTHNLPGIIGLGKALEIAHKNRETENARLIKLRDSFIEEILSKTPDTNLNGPADMGTSQKRPNTRRQGAPEEALLPVGRRRSDEVDAVVGRFSGVPKRLPNNINISIKGVNGQQLLLLLDEEKIYVSTGSACHAGNNIGSHVLGAIKLHPNLIRGSLRLTLGKRTTQQDIEYALEKIIATVTKIRIHQFQKV